jgi:hypothetical protein
MAPITSGRSLMPAAMARAGLAAAAEPGCSIRPRQSAALAGNTGARRSRTSRTHEDAAQTKSETASRSR